MSELLVLVQYESYLKIITIGFIVWLYGKTFSFLYQSIIWSEDTIPSSYSCVNVPTMVLLTQEISSADFILYLMN